MVPIGYHGSTTQNLSISGDQTETRYILKMLRSSHHVKTLGQYLKMIVKTL
jgi:adenosylmethionine-8-amino-7-oxononanoate aminotransferase